MLLGHEEIIVTSGFRLFDYVTARIELRTIPVIGYPPSLDSTVFAVITLGDVGSGQATPAVTNGFKLKDIPDHLDIHQKWRGRVSTGSVECGFFEFLLGHLRSRPEVRLEFPVQDGQIRKFTVRLGAHVELSGRFPADEDILARYFSVVETVQD